MFSDGSSLYSLPEHHRLQWRYTVILSLEDGKIMWNPFRLPGIKQSFAGKCAHVEDFPSHSLPILAGPTKVFILFDDYPIQTSIVVRRSMIVPFFLKLDSLHFVRVPGPCLPLGCWVFPNIPSVLLHHPQMEQTDAVPWSLRAGKPRPRNEGYGKSIKPQGGS